MKSLFGVLLFLVSLGSYATECKGHVAFLNLSSGSGENEDFDYFYEKVKDWFNAVSVTTSYHKVKPTKLSGCFGAIDLNSYEFSLDEFGYVLITPDKKISSIDGTLTDIDLTRLVLSRFSLTPATNKPL